MGASQCTNTSICDSTCCGDVDRLRIADGLLVLDTPPPRPLAPPAVEEERRPPVPLPEPTASAFSASKSAWPRAEEDRPEVLQEYTPDMFPSKSGGYPGQTQLSEARGPQPDVATLKPDMVEIDCLEPMNLPWQPDMPYRCDAPDQPDPSERVDQPYSAEPVLEPPGDENGSRSRAGSVVVWEDLQDEFSDLPPLPEGWIRVKSLSSTLLYYYNLKTGESRDKAPWDVPPGWEQVEGSIPNQPYWWNERLQKSQFDAPTIMDEYSERMVPACHHKLSEFINDASNRTCTGCKRVCRMGVRLFGCRDCEFDLCFDCELHMVEVFARPKKHHKGSE